VVGSSSRTVRVARAQAEGQLCFMPPEELAGQTIGEGLQTQASEQGSRAAPARARWAPVAAGHIAQFSLKH